MLILIFLVVLVVLTGIVDGPRNVQNGVARKAARDARVAVTRNVAKGKLLSDGTVDRAVYSFE